MSLKIESTTSERSEDLVRIFARSKRSGVLATTDKDGNPHGTVIYYTIDDDLSILFASKAETQKVKNIEETGRAALVVYDEPTQTTLQVTGTTEIVDAKSVIEKVISNMGSASMESSAENVFPAEKLTAGDYVVIRLKPLVIKLAEYGFSKANDEDLFETILFAE